MHGRTFLRTMMDALFINNVFAKTLTAFVKFCNEQAVFSGKELKFSKKMPLDSIEVQKRYKNKFIFESKLANGANSK